MDTNPLQVPVAPSLFHRYVAPLRVVIVGGGFSGAVLAAQLLRKDPSLTVAVIDKSPLPARGVAYSTPHQCHLLNVPAENMSAFCEEPDHFLRWARAHHDAAAKPESFLPRAVYGKYIESLVKESAARDGGGSLDWFQDDAVSLARDGDLFTVRLKSGRELRAESVVLALGNPAPRDPAIPGLAHSAKRYASLAWSRAALEDLPQDGSVLLIGSGLTSVDMAVALDARGFRGKIDMVSRHGLIPRRHREAAPWPQFWHRDSPRTSRGLLRLVRREIRNASAAGVNWRGVIDALRPVTQDIWLSLPLTERRRFLRHARSYWEAHRHRIAPEIDAVIFRLRAEGRLHIHGGRITKYSEGPDAAEVVFRCRKNSGHRRLLVDRVINCTGPDMDCRQTKDPLLASLFASGIARPGPLALGLDVDLAGALIDCDGLSSPSLYAIGPVRKGSFWETTAVPEIRTQASELSTHLAQKLRRGAPALFSEPVVEAGA